MNEYETIESLINDMRIKMRIDKDYYATISLCRKIIKLLKYSDNQLEKDYIEENYYIAYNNLSLSYKKIDKIDLAIKNALISLNYSIGFTERMILNYWLLATCYESKGDITKAIEMYRKCSEGYRKIGEQHLRISVVFTIAKLQKNLKAMIKLKNIYESIDITLTNVYTKEDKQRTTEEMTKNIESIKCDNKILLAQMS